MYHGYVFDVCDGHVLCMYVCIYIYIYMYVYIYVCIYIHTYIHICVCVVRFMGTYETYKKQP